jgi:hypothetical protein
MMPPGPTNLPTHEAGSRPRGGVASPFSTAAPSIGAALLFAVLAVTWLVAGARLPGGRWLAVHLFTLGVLTNLVWVFSRHFAAKLTGDDRRDRRRPALAVVLNLGVLATLWGTATGARPALVVGASAVTGVVLVGTVRLRRWRRGAPGARFAWIVRIYERAHGAFVHAAVLGALLGAGVLPGSWHLAARDAHLHLAVLGWGGLTLLATLVFFGPALLRTRMEPGADERAARALRLGATALSVAAVALLLTGVGGTAAVALRLVAGAGLAVLAWAATVVLLPVYRAAVRAKPGAARGPVIGLSVWMPVALTLDAVAVAAGQRRWLEAVGVLLLVGVLAQALLAVLVYLMPMLRGRGFGARDRLMASAERGASLRAFVLNTGVAITAVGVGLGPVAGPGGAFVVRVGWATIAVALVVTLAVILRRRADDDGDAGAAVARRYGG